MFRLALIALILAVATASPAPVKRTPVPDGRIIGGDNAVIETFPYQVSLEYYGSHYCGASIISQNYVLTAGHCVDSFAANQIKVRTGATFRNKGGKIHTVSKLIKHEKYFTNRYGVPEYDIALVKVSKPFKFDDSTQPIGLFSSGESAKPGAKAVITGWGNTNNGLASQLQTVTVPIITKDLCNKAYTETHGGLPNGQICAAYYGVGGKDACQGDSGGPLAIDGRLAGVVSWGNGCAEAYYPGAYTEVAYYRDWIKKHAKL